MTWLWNAWRARWSRAEIPVTTSQSALEALDTMSSDWWRDQHQRTRVRFDGPPWAWPIRRDARD